ncbi:MAG TPA: hypothetical protein VKE70_27190 [Candidatus Solibacter sp.]|nr:hypothetical protein [Candidatus Solibacter sp.]
MRLIICLLVACPLFGQSRDSAVAATDPPLRWVIPSDHPDLKIILRLDGLPDYYRFEFWNEGDATVITKEELLQAIALIKGETKQTAERFCRLGPSGRILNYPCRVRSTLSATGARK